MVILLVGIWLRFVNLDQAPAGLYIDEIDLGYQARSLIETGRDYRGSLSPFYVRSFNADRTPLPAYITVLSTKLFTNPWYQVRGGAAMMGVGIVVLAYLLLQIWTKNHLASLLGALVFALSPWQLQFSRIAFEGTTMAVVYLLGLFCFFLWRKQKKNWQLILATFILALSVYTYRTMSLFAPLTFGILALVYRRELFKVKPLILGTCLLLAVLTMGSFLYATTLASSDQPRIGQISIFGNPEIPIKVMRLRETASGDYQDNTLGQAPVWWSKAFFNKPVFWFKDLAANYLTAWSGSFLFISGDPNPRHGVGQFGVLLLADLLALVAGLGYLYNKKRGEDWVRWLTLWLFLSPLPSVITADGGVHAHRLFIFSLPLLLVVALGWWQIVVGLLGSRRYLLLSGLALFWFWNFSSYWSFYHSIYPYTSARWFGSGYEKAVTKLFKFEEEYDLLAFSQAPDPPIFYYLFWNRISPRLVQDYGTDFSVQRPEKGLLGKLVAINSEEIKHKDLLESIKPRTVYLLTTREVPLDLRTQNLLPKGLKLLGLIKYPDNEVAFYLIARD